MHYRLILFLTLCVTCVTTPLHAHAAKELTYDEAFTYGTSAWDSPDEIVYDNDGNLFIAGTINTGTVDFDILTSGIDEQTNSSGSGYEPYITKYNEDGTYAWTRKWGGTGGNDAFYDIAFDSDNNVYVGGEFWGTVDFDPGVGTAYATSSGSVDPYLVKYNQDGEFQWVKTWGGTGPDRGLYLLFDENDGLYVSSRYQREVDFDPGPGEVIFDTGISNYDPYISKFDTDGNHVWTRTWGSTGVDGARNTVIGDDGNIYQIGYFSGTVDFDPGAGTTTATSAGGYDAFLSVFDTDGNFISVKTWGGTSNDYAHEIRKSADGSLYISGSFAGTVDLNPGAGTYSVTSNNSSEDAYVSKFSADGDFELARVFGGPDTDQAYALTFDSDNNYVIGGQVSGPIDVDFSSAEHILTPTAEWGLFLAAYTEDDEFIDAVMFGTDRADVWYQDSVQSIAIQDTTLYVAGSFTYTMDFDPGDDLDEVTSVDNSIDTYIARYTFTEPTIEESEEDTNESESRSQSSQKGTAIQGQVKNLIGMNKFEDAQKLMQKWHWLFGEADNELVKQHQLQSLIAQLQTVLKEALALGIPVPDAARTYMATVIN